MIFGRLISGQTSKSVLIPTSFPFNRKQIVACFHSQQPCSSPRPKRRPKHVHNNFLHTVQLNANSPPDAFLKLAKFCKISVWPLSAHPASFFHASCLKSFPDSSHRLKDGGKVIQIAAGGEFSSAIVQPVARHEPTSVVTWGHGWVGQLGHKDFKHVCEPRVCLSVPTSLCTKHVLLPLSSSSSMYDAFVGHRRTGPCLCELTQVSQLRSHSFL